MKISLPLHHEAKYCFDSQRFTTYFPKASLNGRGVTRFEFGNSGLFGRSGQTLFQVVAVLPLPGLALALPKYCFQWVLLFLALACLAVAICKIYRVLTRVRRERERMAVWWSKRSARWSAAQQKGFRP
jgi:hypothetical protein